MHLEKIPTKHHPHIYAGRSPFPTFLLKLRGKVINKINTNANTLDIFQVILGLGEERIRLVVEFGKVQPKATCI